LHEAKSLQLMRETGEVHVPPRVRDELAFLQSDWRLPDWFVVDALSEASSHEAMTWQQAGLLDAGEAEAIALAHQLTADWILTDDAAARLFAQQLGLEVHGSLGVLLWAAAIGLLDGDAATKALDRLTASSLWLSTRIVSEARAAIDEMFS
jgi:predicted nucleic acid-binding protein